MAMPYQGPDLSYAQGAWSPQGWEHFAIVNGSRANIGFAVGSYYHWQVDRLRQALLEVGHYFFIGNFDAIQCADFFVDNLYDFRQGDSLWLDMEPEGGTGTVVWSPAKCLAFCLRVFQRTGVMPGIYLNKSLENGYDWSALVAAGVRLWSAYYQGGALPYVRNWPEVSMLQYTSTPIDTNAAAYTQAQMAGAAAPIKQSRRRDMWTLDWDTAGTGYLTTDDGVLPLPSPLIYNLFYRKINSNQLVTPFAAAVAGFVPGAVQGQVQYTAAEQKAVDQNLKLLSAAKQTGIAIDATKLAQALADAGVSITTEVDVDKLTTAFDAAVPRITTSLLAQAGQDLTSQINTAVQSALTGLKIQIDPSGLADTILDAASARLSA